MNLVDLVDENGLQQDEWSLTTPRFGNEDQLQVVGHDSGKGNKKHYILKCIKCSEDVSMFQTGYFRSVKISLTRGQIPCGCASRPRWTKEQFAILCTRKAVELSYTFLGFNGEWQGQDTKIKMLCKKHGEWNTGNISNLISKGTGCPKCSAESQSTLKRKSDGIMAASFLASGSFHPDTTFWRSARLDSVGHKTYWFMSCPECGEIGESHHGNLKQGKRPCSCNSQRQKEAYINVLIDNDRIVAIKFGIAANSLKRVKEQNSNSVYKVTNCSVYMFPSVESCKAAEKDCKKQLVCGIIQRQDMSDGYTETTYVYNLDKIKQIYKKHGGIEVCHSP